MTTLEPFPEDWSRALAVAAHPDDLEYGSASAVARWTAQGKTVTYLLVTDGEAGIEGMAPEQCGPLRREDEIRGAVEVGVDTVEFLGRPDGQVEADLGLRRDLAAAIRRHRPEVLLSINFRDSWGGHGWNHVDHRHVGIALLDAARDAGNTWMFTDLFDQGLEAWAGVRMVAFGGSTPATHGVDVTDTIDRGVASFEAHRVYLDALEGTTGNGPGRVPAGRPHRAPARRWVSSWRPRSRSSLSDLARMPDEPDQPRLRVVQLNAGSLLEHGWEDRRHEIVAWLRRLDPDVVCLQEIWQRIHDDSTNTARGSSSSWASTTGTWPSGASPSTRRSGQTPTCSSARRSCRDGRSTGAPPCSCPSPPTTTVRLAGPLGAVPRRDRRARRVQLPSGVSADPRSPSPSAGGGDRRAHPPSAATATESLATRRPRTALPAILCGDFNAEPDSDEIRFLTSLCDLDGRRTYFQDAWRVAGDGSAGNTQDWRTHRSRRH